MVVQESKTQEFLRKNSRGTDRLRVYTFEFVTRCGCSTYEFIADSRQVAWVLAVEKSNRMFNPSTESIKLVEESE